MSAMDAARIDAVLVGRAVEYTRPGSRSAIDKRVVAGQVVVGPEGLQDDEQGDRRVHGGPDKAIHHYPRDHYAAWRGEIGAHPLLQAPGAFGENISTIGVTEADVCLGDRLRLGLRLGGHLRLRQDHGHRTALGRPPLMGIDALDLDLAGIERLHAVVEPARERELQPGHWSIPRSGPRLAMTAHRKPAPMEHSFIAIPAEGKPVGRLPAGEPGSFDAASK